MAGVGGKFISPFTESEPEQQPTGCCEDDSQLIQFPIPDASALLNDSLDDDLNPELLLEAKLPSESATMEEYNGKVNLDDSLGGYCEDGDETQLSLGCDDISTVRNDDGMTDTTKQTILNDSLCDENETQLPLGSDDIIQPAANESPVTVQQTESNDTSGYIDPDETQLNEDIDSLTTMACDVSDNQATSASVTVSNGNSTLDQSDGTNSHEMDRSSSPDDNSCPRNESPQTKQSGKKGAECKSVSSAVASTASVKVKPSFGKKKSFVAPKVKPLSSPANESPKPALNSKSKKDKSKEHKQSNAKNSTMKSSSELVVRPTVDPLQSPSYTKTSVDTSSTDTTADDVLNESCADTEKSVTGKNSDKSVKSKDSKSAKTKKVDQSAKKQELEKAKLLKKQEFERKKAEKEQLKQKKCLEQERKKAQREQMKMEKELKKLEREKTKAEKLAAAAEKKKMKSTQPKSKTKTTEKQSSNMKSDGVDADVSKQFKHSEISAEDVTMKISDNNSKTNHHDEETSCSTDVQQTSNDEPEPPSPSPSNTDILRANKTGEEPSLNEIATPLRVDSEDTAATSTNTDEPSPTEDNKIEQSVTEEESESTPLSKPAATTKSDQPKSKVAGKKFSQPKQKGLKKKAHNSTKPTKTSKKKPLKQSSTTGNVKTGKKRKALSTESDSEKGSQSKRSKSVNYSGPVWVQCDNDDCSKWRQLRDCQDPALVPDKWTCSMNINENYNSCSAPEEQWSDFGDSQEFVESPFIPGSIVWAKMDGYPWWPAMIEEDPDDEAYYKMSDVGDSLVPVEYHAVFFDTTVCRAWVSAYHVTTFTSDQHTNPNKDINVVKRLRRPLAMARKQAVKALGLDTKERLSQFGFMKRYHDNGRVRKRKRMIDNEETSRPTSSRGYKSARLMSTIHDNPPTIHEAESNESTPSHDEDWKQVTGGGGGKKKQRSSKTLQAEE